MTFRLRRRRDTRTWFRRKTAAHASPSVTSGSLLEDILLSLRLVWTQYRDAFTARHEG